MEREKECVCMGGRVSGRLGVEGKFLDTLGQDPVGHGDVCFHPTVFHLSVFFFISSHF